MIHFSVDIEPMGAVRMTQKSKFKDPAAQRYLAYKNVIGWSLKSQRNEIFTKPCKVNLRFYMPIPKSLTLNKRNGLDGSPHINKPDIDNLIKGIFDSANGVLWRDDRQVVRVTAAKLYDMNSRIEIEIEEISS